MIPKKKKKKLAAGVILFIPLSLFALFAWAFLWPDDTCSEPACSRKRFDLFVELDTFRDIEPIQLEVKTDDGVVSARKILRAGGFDLRLEVDDDILPYSPESGPLDRADLYQYALAWRNLAAPSQVDAQIYALVAPSIVSDRGERLFGIMFDSAGREGIAIAPLQTVRTFEHYEADAIPMLQLRTFLHEMLHSLNRRHLDAVQMPDGRVTLEAPTRCLMKRDGDYWRLTEPPLMALSPTTIQFFQTAIERDVLPGGSNTPFEGLRGSADECADARSNVYEESFASRWEFAKRRLFAVLGLETAEAQELLEELDSQPPVRLQLQAQQAAYPLGYPIAVRIIARNDSDAPLPLRGRLAPAYGLVQIEYRFQGENEWRAFQPLAWFEPANDEEAILEPGTSFDQTAPIYFGDDGWTFPEPGTYELRATLKTSEQTVDAVSDVITMSVEAAETDDERAMLQPLLDDAGMLDAEVGRWLTFGGGIGNTETQTAIIEAVKQYSHTPVGSALRLTLASQRLKPPIDPRTGERAEPDLQGANELLVDTCSDSGIEALKHELLMRFGADMPTPLLSHLQSSAEAWEGITRTRETVATYSDHTLSVAPASLHFCWNEAGLRGQARTQGLRLARDLKRSKAERIVVVGHADYAGTCRFNDELAMRRADTVKRLLVQAGIPSKRIQTVALGERRPLNFSIDDAARELNRRVEILVQREENDAAEEEAEVRRVLPACGTPGS